MATATVNEAVKDLVLINHDRYQGYKKAAEETEDSDLKNLFIDFSDQSLGYASELKKYMDAEEAQQLDPDDTTVVGKLYRVYMDVKSAIMGRDRKAILASCEYGEDAAQKTYEEALEHSGNFSPDVLALVQTQKTALRQAHDRVKMMRDSLS